MSHAEGGFIKIPRSMLSSEIMTNARYWRAFCIMLMKVNYAENTSFDRYGKTVICGRGQSTLSLQSWAALFGWSKDATLRFFRELENIGFITRKADHSGSLMTVVKYNEWQGKPDRKQDRKQVTRKEVKKNIPTKDEVINYFKEKGFKVEDAVRAFDHYNKNDWHDDYGREVKNWRLKMVNVWFKENNKAPIDPSKLEGKDLYEHLNKLPKKDRTVEQEEFLHKYEETL